MVHRNPKPKQEKTRAKEPPARLGSLKACGIETISMFAVLVREIGPPKGVEPLEGILLTSNPVECFEEAFAVIEYYEKRWRVDDYHKCLKTGCQVESRQ